MVTVELVVVLIAVLLLVVQRLLSRRRAPIRAFALEAPVTATEKVRPPVEALLPDPRGAADAVQTQATTQR